jgi:probable rRNA maturation factor
VTKPTGLRVDVDSGACTEATASLLERAVRRTLEAEGHYVAEVSLALLSDADIQELNLRYLGKDYPTDVLAFSLGDGEDVLGDVYVGLDQATRQAAELGIALEEELVRLAVHGTLHVLGHDHPEGPEREQSAMFRLQERLVRELFAEGAAG